jgi:hypothetical protein
MIYTVSEALGHRADNSKFYVKNQKEIDTVISRHFEKIKSMTLADATKDIAFYKFNAIEREKLHVVMAGKVYAESSLEVKQEIERYLAGKIEADDLNKIKLEEVAKIRTKVNILVGINLVLAVASLVCLISFVLLLVPHPCFPLLIAAGITAGIAWIFVIAGMSLHFESEKLKMSVEPCPGVEEAREIIENGEISNMTLI